MKKLYICGLCFYQFDVSERIFHETDEESVFSCPCCGKFYSLPKRVIA